MSGNPLSSNTRLPQGHLLAGRYRIAEEIGRGGAGVVYRAAHVALGREVAIKILPRSKGSHGIYRARFEREARVACALEHPSSVEIHDFGEEEGLLYLVMQLLRGQTLRTMLTPRGTAIDYETTLEYGRAVADLLLSAHEMKLIHRDLKPENIFLEPEGRLGRTRVVVVDFGLAFIDESESMGRITDSGMMSGTPQYMAPEQCRARPVGPPADIYALGCVLYEMITGDVPFDGPGFEVLSAQLYRPPPAIEAAKPDPDRPRAFDALIMRMLRKRADERPSARDVLMQMERLAGVSGRQERSRDQKMLGPREQRMITARTTRPPEPQAALKTSEIPHIKVGLFGQVSEELKLALRVNGVEPCEVTPGVAVQEMHVLWAVEQPVATLVGLVATGRPVVADADPSDLDRISALLRAGVAEVVPVDAPAAQVVPRLQRAARRAMRRAR